MGEAFLHRTKGVVWKKYSVHLEETYSDFALESHYDDIVVSGDDQFFVYEGYTYDPSYGFSVEGMGSDYAYGNALEGMVLYCSATEVQKYDFKTDLGGGRYHYNILISTCSKWVEYSKAEEIGITVAATGVQPEEGSLIEGNPDGNYCIVSTDSGTYYYERMGR